MIETKIQERLSITAVTKSPMLRPAKNEDGVTTGMWITLQDSVALSDAGPVALPAGTVITSALSGGIDCRMSCMCDRRKIGTAGEAIVYRA